MDVMKPDDYDNLSNQVRQQCTQKLIGLEQALLPYVNGDFGDIAPGHIIAYVNVIKELGRLWGAQRPPREAGNRIPLAQVEAMLAAAQERQEAAVAAAIEETRELMREEHQASTALSIESAKSAVLARMKELGQQGEGTM